MAVSANFLHEISDNLVISAKWSDGVLSIFGKEWSFSTLCEWQLRHSGDASNSVPFDTRLRELEGKSLTDVKVGGSGDVALEFSNGSIVDVQNDGSGDAWALDTGVNVYAC